MARITIKHKGDFSKATRYFEKVGRAARVADLDKYGKEGVAALASATPLDSGQTANSWHYEVVHSKGRASISFYNSNIQN